MAQLSLSIGFLGSTIRPSKGLLPAQKEERREILGLVSGVQNSFLVFGSINIKSADCLQIPLHDRVGYRRMLAYHEMLHHQRASTQTAV